MYWNNQPFIQIIIICVSLIAWILYLTVKYAKRKYRSHIKVIQLLNDHEEVIKEWYIKDEQGLIIGKKFQNQAVDIDLTGTNYAVLIDKEHAVLNFINGKWFLEDLESRNGTGFKSAKEMRIQRLVDGKSIEVQAGDRIYIAKSILQLVK